MPVGVSPEEIAQGLGVSIDEIEEIKDSTGKVTWRNPKSIGTDQRATTIANTVALAQGAKKNAAKFVPAPAPVRPDATNVEASANRLDEQAKQRAMLPPKPDLRSGFTGDTGRMLYGDKYAPAISFGLENAAIKPARAIPPKPWYSATTAEEVLMGTRPLGNEKVADTAIARALGRGTETAGHENPSPPLINLKAFTPEQGIARGVAEFASEQTTPEMLAMMAAGGPVIGLARKAGAHALERGVLAGFSASGAKHLYDRFPEVYATIKEHGATSPQAKQELTKYGLESLIPVLAGYAAWKGPGKLPPKPWESKPIDEATIRQFDELRSAAAEPPPPPPVVPVAATPLSQVIPPAPKAQHAKLPPKPQSEQPVAPPEPIVAHPVTPAAEPAPLPASESPQVPGGPAPGEPGWIGNVPTESLAVDPVRLQYKRNVGKGGAGEEFREVNKWDPEKSGILSVWRDPQDGNSYVVNGHNRYAMAERLGEPTLAVRYMKAADAREARLKGALINISEGRGDSLDAAKVFRESGMTVEDLAGSGVSLRGKIASEGMALARLQPAIFDDVISGQLQPARASVIGSGLQNHADQLAIYKLLKQREAKGKRLTNDQLAEMIRRESQVGTPEVQEQGDNLSLFGDDIFTRKLIQEKAEVSDYIRQQLIGDKKLFGLVGKESAASRLSEAGNVIEAGKNQEIATSANQILHLYDKLSTTSGKVSDILNAAAEEVASGKNTAKAKSNAYKAIRDEITSEFGGLTGKQPQPPAADALGVEGSGQGGSSAVSAGKPSGPGLIPPRPASPAPQSVLPPKPKQGFSLGAVPEPEGGETLGTGLGGLQKLFKRPAVKRPDRPLTPSEEYAYEMAEKREAARGKISRVDKIKGIASKANWVDTSAPLVDTVRQHEGWKKDTPGALSVGARLDAQIDKVLRANTGATRFLSDHGIVNDTGLLGWRKNEGIISQVDDMVKFDALLTARHEKAFEIENAARKYGKKDPKTGRKVHDYKAATAYYNKAVKQGKNGRFTGRNLAKEEALLKEFEPQYKQYADKVDKFTNDLMDYALEKQLISAEQATAMRDAYGHYVPMKRVFSEIENNALGQNRRGGGERGVASIGSQSGYMKSQGSERVIESPMVSIIEKTQKVFAQGEKNANGLILADMADKTKGFPMAPIKESQVRPEMNTIEVLRNGEKQFYLTTPELAAAAKHLDPWTVGEVGKWFQQANSLYKVFTTGASPVFALGQIAGDIGQTAVTAKDLRSTFSPRIWGKAIFDSFGKRELWREMEREGAGFTSWDIYRNPNPVTIEKIRARKNIKTMGEFAKEHPIETLKELFDVYADTLAGSEKMGRARLYRGRKEAALREGFSEEESRILAANEANFALPNYLRQGKYVKVLNSFIPYFSAGIAGSRSNLRVAGDNPARAAAGLAFAIILPTVASTLWNLSDPERAAIYKDIQEYDKKDYHIVIGDNTVQGKRGDWTVPLKLKITPGLNHISSMVRRMIEQAHGLDPVGVKEMFDHLIGAVSPVEPNWQSAMSVLLPQFSKPVAQAAPKQGYDYFRRQETIPDHLKNKPIEYQYQPWTSGSARLLGRAIGVAPLKVEKFVRDTIGTEADRMIHYLDKALATVGAIPEDEIGGRGLWEAISARFGAARGGAIQRKEWEHDAELQAKGFLGQMTHMDKSAIKALEENKIHWGDIGIMEIGPKEARVKETDDEYLNRSVLRGLYIDDSLRKVLESQEYRSASKGSEERQKMLKDAVSEAQREITELVRSEEYADLEPKDRVQMLKHEIEVAKGWKPRPKEPTTSPWAGWIFGQTSPQPEVRQQ